MNEHNLKIGRRVKSNRELSGVPAGTDGEVVEASNSWPESQSVAIAWQRYPGDKLTIECGEPNLPRPRNQ